MRAFIAIDLPENIRESLGRRMDEIRQALDGPGQPNSRRGSGFRWSRPEGIHLTLKFLGEISDSQVHQVSNALAKLGRFEGFSIEVKGLGCFPTVARPRVFWAGVNAPPDLARLAGQVESKMEELGFGRESREYHPHLTLARIANPRPNPALQALIENQKGLTFGSFEVSNYFLFESKLSPQGSQYRKVAPFPVTSEPA